MGVSKVNCCKYSFEDRRRIRNSLILVVGSSVIGGLSTNDKFGALTPEVSGFNSMVQAFSESWSTKSQDVLDGCALDKKVPFYARI